jgi:hypothetical protein
MLKDMLLPSTANETILSMADAECRETLYRSGLKVTNVEFWQPRCSCKRKAKKNEVDEKKNEKREEKCEKQHETQLVGVHRQRALEKGHFRKDRHRSFRIAVYMTRKRSHTA